MAEDTAPEEWAIVEIMGHRRLAGRIQQVTRFGADMLRIDRPMKDGTFVTEFYGGSSIYAVRPCTEAIARGAEESWNDPRPIAPLDYQPAKPDRDLTALPVFRSPPAEDDDDETERMF